LDLKITLNKIASILLEKNLKIAIAESATGGLIANNITNIPGSSNFFDRGLVTYSNNAKIELLTVSKDLIEKHGAVSKEVAEAMAEGVRINSNVDIGLSTTGIAGPTGGSKEKPVGLVFISYSDKDKTISKKIIFKGSRLENKESFCNAALNLLFENIK